MHADFLSHDMPFCFEQQHITSFREHIALSILNGKAACHDDTNNDNNKKKTFK